MVRIRSLRQRPPWVARENGTTDPSHGHIQPAPPTMGDLWATFRGEGRRALDGRGSVDRTPKRRLSRHFPSIR